MGSGVSMLTDAGTNRLARAERRALDQVVASLSERFPQVTLAVIERIVDHRYLQFYGAPLREYIPILVEREASADLRTQFGAVPLHKQMRTS
jgi:hypothetical protein